MIPPCSCAMPGRKPGTSSKVTSGTLKASQKRMNRAAFTLALMSSTPARTAGWLATMPTLCPPRWAKPTMMFAANSLCTSTNSPSSITRLRTSCMSYGLFALSGTTSSSAAGRCVHIVRRNEAEQRADSRDALELAGAREVGHAAHLAVRLGAAELLHRDVLVRHCLHDVRARHEHERRAAHHEGEVGDRRRVHRPARARPENRRDLRNDAGRERVAQEDFGVAAEGNHALLNTRPAGVVETDHGRAVFHRQVHHLADLLGVRLAQRAAEHREVLREDVHETAVDTTEAGDHAVAVGPFVLEAEVRRTVRDEAVELREAAFVQEPVEPFARRELSFGVLGRHTFGAAAKFGFGASLLEEIELVSHGHRRPGPGVIWERNVSP